MNRRFHWGSASGLLAACALSLGCASSPPPFALSSADFGKVAVPPGRPLVVAFKAGERIPVIVDVSGEIVELEPRPSRIWLVAKRDFFVRVDRGRVTTSLDGVHFDRKPDEPGSFRLGFGADAATGPHVEVAIVTPVHAR